MPKNSPKMLWTYGILHFLLLILLSAWFYQQNQAVDIVKPQLAANQKLQCVSYAPYYGKDQSPFIVGIKISPAQIDADLKKLAAISDCVRTYSVGQGMDYVPEAAEKVGLKVYLGAWIGWVNADNELEVNLAAKQANAFPDTVKALIIGNEVFLRQEQKEAAMQRYIKLARQQTKTPITYADVWEFWNKHKAMEQHVDFITVHVLPYWENDPLDIDHAVIHASNVMRQLESTFKKPILIGETGWPSVGRQRNESQPSLVNQARYVREFLQMAHEKNWQYNIIEAIDQPWKRTLEGTVGGYWGLYSHDLQEKFSLTDPVSPRDDGKTPIYYALMGAMLFLAIALWKKEQRTSVLFALFSLGAVAGLTALLQLEYLIAACRNYWEWWALGGVAVLGWIGIFMQPWQLKNASSSTQQSLLLIRASLLLTAIFTSTLIFMDGRYRDYPTMLFILPVLVLSFNTLCISGLPKFKDLPAPNMRPSFLLCWVALVLSTLCLLAELNNFAAVTWMLINVFLVFTFWLSQKTPVNATK